jgi:alkaline phosphatase
VTKKILVCTIGFLSAFLLSTGMAQTTSEQVCTDWTQVNEDGFALGTGGDSDYSNEEGFETLVFNNQLYLGMEADNTLGARLWRTREGVSVPQNQSDWEEVAADGQGNPFGVPDPVQNDHVDSLATFNGYMYASTANRSGAPSGIQVFRSPNGNPGSWVDTLEGIGVGFGDLDNENFKDMQVFQGYLCGGTWNFTTGAQVWCTQDGKSWSQHNYGGFGTQSKDPSNAMIWSGGVFENGLYFGVENSGTDPLSPFDDIGKLYRSTNLTRDEWDLIFESGAGSLKVDILGELDSQFYISTQSDQGILIYRSQSGDLGSWQQVNLPGMGKPENEGTVVDGAVVYRGVLYLSITNWNSGVEVWRTSGIHSENDILVDWTLVTPNGFGDPNNTRAQLITFNDHLYAWTSNFESGQQVFRSFCPSTKYVIVFLGDGMGVKQIEATDAYTKNSPVYEKWKHYWITTYPDGGNYDPDMAWTNFTYVTNGTTDSAAAATALFTGKKTANRRINVSSDGTLRYFSLSDKARQLGKATGAVTSVFTSHATPGAWYAHNDDRNNGYAIADEGFWGDPNTTGDPNIDIRYRGGHGDSLPPPDVILGAGHPSWNGGDYINTIMREKLIQDSLAMENFAYVERIDGSPDGAKRLVTTVNNPKINHLIGLFGGGGGNLDFRLADGSQQNPENPTLTEMVMSALTVLNRDAEGFILMVEGGAIDWGNHNNNMDQVIGEMVDFNQAVETAVNWVDNPTNDSSWKNTLIVVTADHESGYLTAGPGEYPDKPLGIINSNTIALEKQIEGSDRRASWQDSNANNLIDVGETVYWAWNSGGHTNSLVPLFTRGIGEELFDVYLEPTQNDPVRGLFLDNTDVFKVLDAITLRSEPNKMVIYLPIVNRDE